MTAIKYYMWHQWFNRNFTKLHEYFLFCTQKVFSQFRKFTVKPLISHGLFYQCPPYYVCAPGNIQLSCCLCRVRKLSDFIQKYLNLCSEDEQRSYGFVTTGGRVINDIIFIFGWIIPLMRLFRIWFSVGDAVTSLHRWVMAAWRLFPSAVRTGERTHAGRTASRERPSIPHAYSSKVTP